MVMGASLPQMFRDNEFSFYYINGQLHSGWEKMSEQAEASSQFDASQVQKLIVDAGAMNVTFQTVSGNEILVEQTNASDLVSVSLQDGVLKIEEKAAFGMFIGSSYNVSVNILIPEDKILENMDISVDAGEISSVGILSCKSATLDVDTGNLEMNLAGLNMLEASVDVGNARLSLHNAGNISVETDTGDIVLNMDGCNLDYNYNLETDLGNITIDGYVYNEMDDKLDINHNADKFMNVECDMGNVDIYFSGYDFEGTYHERN